MPLLALLGKRRRERTVYFPWERRGLGRALALPRRRARAWVLLALAAGVLVWIQIRNHERRKVRITRATIERTREAIDAWRADHPGRCPRDLVELTTPGDHAPWLAGVPVDAWQRPLRFACPSRDPSLPYDLASGGPAGEPFGLGRIE